jgi:hypothetical protein
MSHNMYTLLTTAAEMRAVGHSWDSVARKVHRKPKTCQKWPGRFPIQWQQLYSTVQKRRFEDSCNDAHTLVQKLMRSDDPKIQTQDR